MSDLKSNYPIANQIQKMSSSQLGSSCLPFSLKIGSAYLRNCKCCIFCGLFFYQSERPGQSKHTSSNSWAHFCWLYWYDFLRFCFCFDKFLAHLSTNFYPWLPLHISSTHKSLYDSSTDSSTKTIWPLKL